MNSVQLLVLPFTFVCPKLACHMNFIQLLELPITYTAVISYNKQSDQEIPQFNLKVSEIDILSTGERTLTSKIFRWSKCFLNANMKKHCQHKRMDALTGFRWADMSLLLGNWCMKPRLSTCDGGPWSCIVMGFHAVGGAPCPEGSLKLGGGLMGLT